MRSCTLAMSHAKKDESEFALCSHISKFDFDLFYRAKPVTEMERQRNRGAWRTNRKTGIRCLVIKHLKQK